MKTKETKQFIRWCILGAIGCGLMAAGDWLLGCVPLQKTDTGLFNRACYLSGSYGLWRPVLTVGLGAIGGFLYYFVVKALNADIDEKYRKTRTIQFLCGIFTVAIALTIHTWVATMAWFTTYLGPRIRAEAALAAVTAYQDDMLPRDPPHVCSDAIGFWYPFCDAACRKNALSKVDACFPSGHMEPSAGCSTGYCAGNADAGGYMDVRDEPEQHEQCYHDLVHRGCGL